ncbi:zf-DHHC-domain-containing protein, partial [Xylona heveae TC161]
SKRHTWSQTSRFASKANTSLGGVTTGSEIGTESRRPQSSASKTHVPSLASHAFFRPLSSQRLQAQRGRPSPATFVPAKENVPLKDADSEIAHELDSKINQKRNSAVLLDSEKAQPPSRGTECTEFHGQEMITGEVSPAANRTGTSTAGSAHPLTQASLAPNEPTGTVFRRGSAFSSPLEKDQGSFRSNFLLPSQNLELRDNQIIGREKLASADSSPQLGPYETNNHVRRDSERNYQYFPGNTVFCFGGRLQNTKDRPVNIVTFVLVILPSALFFGFSAPWLWLHVSPAIPILFAYLFLICVSSFTHASVTDPGILPRKTQPFPPANDADDPLTLGSPTTDWTLIKSAASPTSAMEVPTKYCKTCNIWRPPRGHHCRVCDNCVETQDHHCVWLNNCIGRRNYRFFISFVASCTCLGLFLLGASLAHILLYESRESISFRDSISHLRVPFAMVLYGALATPYPASLWGYHLFLMARGETTREYLNSHKFLKKDRHRPFTQGNILRNWLAVVNRPRPPTYIRFKEKHEAGDQRFNLRR